MRVRNIVIIQLFILLNYPAGDTGAQDLSFDEYSIENNFPGMSCIVTFDLDGDGDLDIVGGSEYTPYTSYSGLAWWRNEGGDPLTWTRFTIDPSFDNVMSVEVADIDADGFPDITATSWNDHVIAWYENSGNPCFLWMKRIVVSSFTNAHDAECADIDQDGDVDLVGINSTPGSVIVCYSSGSSPPTWIVQTVASSFAGGKAVSLLDFDHDGDTDIIGCAMDAHTLAWWENQGGSPASWAYHFIASNMLGCIEIDPVYMDGDSLYDVLITDGTANAVYCFLCVNLAAGQWTRRLVAYPLALANNVRGKDFDRDGDIDVVAVGKIPGQLSLYENTGTTWNASSLRSDYPGGWALACDDMNGDGLIDIVSGASELGDLYLYENSSIVTATDPVPDPWFHLCQNWPNPFNPVTTISFGLSHASRVKLSIYDVSGRLVRVVLDEDRAAGHYTEQWNGLNSRGVRESSGVYFLNMAVEGHIQTRKMILLE